MLLLFLTERKVDGKAFIELTREDFSIIYSDHDKFLVASRLFKISKNAKEASERTSVNTSNLLDELHDLNSRGSLFGRPSDMSTPVSRASTPISISSGRGSTPVFSRKSSTSSASENEPRSKRRCVQRDSSVKSKFKLPVFSPEVRQCITKDSFYTSTQRNRLIKEACLALRGYLWEKNQTITNEVKRGLARSLYQLAPMSLGDGESEEVKINYYHWCSNNYQLFDTGWPVWPD